MARLRPRGFRPLLCAPPARSGHDKVGPQKDYSARDRLAILQRAEAGVEKLSGMTCLGSDLGNALSAQHSCLPQERTRSMPPAMYSACASGSRRWCCVSAQNRDIRVKQLVASVSFSQDAT